MSDVPDPHTPVHNSDEVMSDEDAAPIVPPPFDIPDATFDQFDDLDLENGDEMQQLQEEQARLLALDTNDTDVSPAPPIVTSEPQVAAPSTRPSSKYLNSLVHEADHRSAKRLAPYFGVSRAEMSKFLRLPELLAAYKVFHAAVVAHDKTWSPCNLSTAEERMEAAAIAGTQLYSSPSKDQVIDYSNDDHWIRFIYFVYNEYFLRRHSIFYSTGIAPKYRVERAWMIGRCLRHRANPPSKAARAMPVAPGAAPPKKTAGRPAFIAPEYATDSEREEVETPVAPVVRLPAQPRRGVKPKHVDGDPNPMWFLFDDDGQVIGGDFAAALGDFPGTDWLDVSATSDRHDIGADIDDAALPGGPNPIHLDGNVPLCDVATLEERQARVDKTAADIIARTDRRGPPSATELLERQKLAVAAKIARARQRYQYRVLFMLADMDRKGLREKIAAEGRGSDLTNAIVEESAAQDSGALVGPNGQDDDEVRALAEPDKIMPLTEQTEEFRERQRQFHSVLDRDVLQPTNYEESLNILYIDRRSSRLLPGQFGKPLMWWQVTGAAAMKTRRREREVNKAGPRGMVIADNTGLGKTETALAAILSELGERKALMQTLFDEKKWDELAAVPPPKPYLWLTPPTLVRQASREASEFSREFDVFVYGSMADINDPDPPGVRRISRKLTSTDAFFDPHNENTAHRILICSYNILSVRHGPTAMSTWLHKACGLTKDEAKSRQRGWVKNFAYGLANNFRGAILDEAQAVKNPKSQANLATRWLRLDWVTLLTATPIPWRTTDFGGLLLLIHDRDLDRQAGELADTGVLADPYLEQAPVAQHPFRATHTAFKTFINNDMDEVEQGRRLALVFDQVLIRRDFSSRCVINPQGDEHMIGSAMPKSRVVQLRLRNDPYAQFIFDQCSGEHRRSLMIKDLATGKFQLNGRSLRTLNLMSINPIFHFAEEIHDARSAASARYRQLFHEQKYEDILHGLLSNIVLTATREKFPNVIKDNLVPPKTNSTRLVGSFTTGSARLRALLAALTDQVVIGREKALIFCQHPFEQLFLASCLNLCGIRAKALLSDMDAGAKDKLVTQFNTRNQPAEVDLPTHIRAMEIDVLIMSYAMNAGLNLHHQCFNLHGFSPAPSWPIWVQAMGRIVRFGQQSACLILSYVVEDTFNLRQLQTNTNNALSQLSALVNPMSLADDFGVDVEKSDYLSLPMSVLDDFVLWNDQMYHLGSSTIPQEARDEGHRLSPKDAILFIFQGMVLEDMTFFTEDEGEKRLGATTHLFGSAAALASTKKKYTSTPSKDRHITDETLANTLTSDPAELEGALAFRHQQPPENFVKELPEEGDEGGGFEAHPWDTWKRVHEGGHKSTLDDTTSDHGDSDGESNSGPSSPIRPRGRKRPAAVLSDHERDELDDPPPAPLAFGRKKRAPNPLLDHPFTRLSGHSSSMFPNVQRYAPPHQQVTTNNVTTTNDKRKGKAATTNVQTKAKRTTKLDAMTDAERVAFHKQRAQKAADTKRRNRAAEEEGDGSGSRQTKPKRKTKGRTTAGGADEAQAGASASITTTTRPSEDVEMTDSNAATPTAFEPLDEIQDTDGDDDMEV